MYKNKKHHTSFKLKLIRQHHRGSSIKELSMKWGLSRSLLTRWVDHYNSSGIQGLLPRPHHFHTIDFKFKVVESYRNEGLSLRNCCLRYNIANESTVLGWLRKYELMGIEGLSEQRGRPKVMEKNKKKSPKKSNALTRLEELEKENLYLRAENELLKKLEALAQKKGTSLNKKR
jgi:transposase